MTGPETRFDNLRQHARDIQELVQLLKGRSLKDFSAHFDGFFLDFTRQRVSRETMHLLIELAEESHLQQKIKAMFAGERINSTENRPVLHVALRANKNDTYNLDGENVVPKVHSVLNQIRAFSNSIRSGAVKGVTGQNLTDVVCIGIGGSYLGAEFVFESLRSHKKCAENARGRRLRFLANVDPVAVDHALSDLNPASTLVIIISKTFTTAETMLNARTVRRWLLKNLRTADIPDADIISRHMIALSANPSACAEFGIDTRNVFGFWDWVGGRFSVCSAVGVTPLALHYGFDQIEEFLEGARSMDRHFLSTPFTQNLPVLMALLTIWNSTILGFNSKAILPYAQGLSRFPAHIQQLDMESNGKRVSKTGDALPFECGELVFGEPGTNSQHSFFQLIHQGRVVPCEFIGYVHSQHPIEEDSEVVSNHDELLSNLIAQPDALAYGKTVDQLKAEGVPERLIPHKTFPGNRPSLILLIDRMTPYSVGQLLSLYEHKTAVQGFIWDINSFDQWGVELGKVLGQKVRSALHDARATKKFNRQEFHSHTAELLDRILKT